MDRDRTDRQDDSALRQLDHDRAVAHLRPLIGGTRDIQRIPATGLVIGRRSADTSVGVHVDDTRTSRTHARIERNPAWRLVDLGSRNGAFVDGRTVATGLQAELRDGSVIRIGDTIFIFRLGEAIDATPDSNAFPGVAPIAGRVRRRIASLASTSGHVLVLGETGTGKERASRAIAHASAPFVTLNCAELTRDLARSELFGHVRGAFSGATHNKPGLVEQAAHGTLFLDEVGELALEVQADLLRFLEDGSYRPVGATELRYSDARVVAATNVDLDAAIREGKFRRDLVARLRASNEPLELPPLRDRREDIPMWIRHFLDEASRSAQGVPWTVGALECLLLFPWPENLRELRGVVRSIVAEDSAMPWVALQLPARLHEHRTVLRAPAEQPPVIATPAKDLSAEEIRAALARTNGRMRTTAQQLGIDRRKLYRLCERYGIALEEHRGPNQEGDNE